MCRSEYLSLRLALAISIVWAPLLAGSSSGAEPNSKPQNLELELPFFGKNLGENLIKMMFPAKEQGKHKNPLPFLDFLPKLAELFPTTTTTTTASPIEVLTDKFVKISPIKLPESSQQTLNKVIKDISTQDSPLIEAANQMAVIASKFLPPDAPPEEENVLYEFSYGEEPFKHRRSRYFSMNCNFRFACEIGRLSNLVTMPYQQVERIFLTNKHVEDLQNRYTRAISYGILNRDCERYYCLMAQFFGGPREFAKGLAELSNRVANPEMYDS